MQHPLPVLMDVDDLDAVQAALVGGLSAALGIKGSLIENDLVTLWGFGALQDSGRKPAQMTVNIIQLLGFHNSPREDFLHYIIRICPLQRREITGKVYKNMEEY